MTTIRYQVQNGRGDSSVGSQTNPPRRPDNGQWARPRRPTYRIEEYVCEDNRHVEDPTLRYQPLRVN